MSLELPLRCVEQGHNLISIVKDSMQEMDGWNVSVTRGMKCSEVEEDGPRYELWGISLPHPFVKEYPLVLFNKSIGSENPDEILLCANRWGRIKGRPAKMDFVLECFLGIPLTGGLAVLCYLMRSYKKYKPHTDRLFISIDPAREYSSLEVYANASYDHEKPQDGGRVPRFDSPQFKKLERVWHQLAKNINDKLPQQQPYR
jgi:hypothetical protein